MSPNNKDEYLVGFSNRSLYPHKNKDNNPRANFNLTVEDDNQELAVTRDDSEIVIMSHQEDYEPLTRPQLQETVSKLATKIFESLARDREALQRHATRLWVRTGPTKKKSKDIQCFLMKRPRDTITWNQATASEIEIQILKRLLEIPVEFKWVRLEVHLDVFTLEKNIIEADLLDVEPTKKKKRKKKVRSGTNENQDSGANSEQQGPPIDCVNIEDDDNFGEPDVIIVD